MREFQARWRSTRAIFYAVLLAALVWLCDSFAAKCGKANKSSRKCAGKKYFLSKELARAAELQQGSTICRVHWDEIRRSNNRCSVPKERPQETANSSETFCCPGSHRSNMSCQNCVWNFYYLVLNFHSLLFTEEMVLMHVHSLLYCRPNFIFSISLLFH